MSRKMVPLHILVIAAMTAAGCAPSSHESGQAVTPEGAAPASTKSEQPAAEAALPPVLPAAVPGTGPENPYSQAQVERGKFLATIGSCNECHTPWVFDEALGSPAPDRTRLLSGHPAGVPAPRAKAEADTMLIQGATGTSFTLAFGVVYSPNLTPDIDTGIGSWTEEMWINTFRKATHMGGGGRPILPPMPWPNVAVLSDEDLVALYAYMRSVPPIRNGVFTTNPPQEVMDGISRTNQMILEEIASQRSSAP